MQKETLCPRQVCATNRKCSDCRRGIWDLRSNQRMFILALQLCPQLQFGPLTYQPIEWGREWGFVSSNQSALWSCLLHVTSQLGEGCSMSFVRFSVLIVWKTCVWNTFGAFSLMGFGEFYRSLRFVRNFPRSTHIFICWRARKPGTRMKAQSEISKKDSSNKNVFSSVWGKVLFAVLSKAFLYED